MAETKYLISKCSLMPTEGSTKEPYDLVRGIAAIDYYEGVENPTIALVVTFIDVMKELPITLILRPFNFDTLATQTYEFAVEEMIPLSAIYSLVIITLGSVMLLILRKFIDKQINVS